MSDLQLEVNDLRAKLDAANKQLIAIETDRDRAIDRNLRLEAEVIDLKRRIERLRAAIPCATRIPRDDASRFCHCSGCEAIRADDAADKQLTAIETDRDRAIDHAMLMPTRDEQWGKLIEEAWKVRDLSQPNHQYGNETLVLGLADALTEARDLRKRIGKLEGDLRQIAVFQPFEDEEPYQAIAVFAKKTARAALNITTHVANEVAKEE